MLKNYFTVAWRSLLRTKGFSFINISGLTIGMTVAILISLWVFDEIAANRNFDNYKKIGEVRQFLNFGGDIIAYDGGPYVYGQKLEREYPEINSLAMTSILLEHIVSIGDNKLSRQGFFVDPEFVEMFSLNLVGDRAALRDSKSIMLSKSLARALAGDDALGKAVRFNGKADFTIAAIFEDFPSNSRFSKVDMLLPMSYYATIDEVGKYSTLSNESFDFSLFVMVNDGVDMEALSTKIRDVLLNSSGEQGKAIEPRSFIFPMERWNLYGEFKNGENTGGKIEYVWMFSIVGGFVLLLACINFMNLSTARAEKRSKEVGVRKVMGSLRQQLVGQFLGESFLIVLLAFVASIGVVTLALPWYNTLTEKQLFIPWNESWFVISMLAFVLITSMLAGSYPALYLASFKPVSVLKGTVRAGRSSIISRKTLVVFQFVISIAIIVCTLTVSQQIRFTKDRPVGFDVDNTIYIQIRTADLRNADQALLRNDLLATGVVENVATSDFPITGGMSGNASTTWPGKDPAQQPMVAINGVSHDFPSTNGFQFVEGRDFSRDFASDSAAVIINQMAAKLMSPGKSALGMTIRWGDEDRHVVGVIEDQVRWGPSQKQSPHIYEVAYGSTNFITIRFEKNVSMQDALARVEVILKKYDPGAPFQYTFVDDDYARQFKTEERIENLSIVFASLTIFISCIGILGLASFAASQRMKEIGIRKVLGASVFGVWRLLSTDFVLLVMIAIAIATPAGWYFSKEWLQQYEYRIDLSPWTFVLTGLGIVAITLVTVSYQSIAAAMTNPVKSLRSE